MTTNLHQDALQSYESRKLEEALDLHGIAADRKPDAPHPSGPDAPEHPRLRRLRREVEAVAVSALVFVAFGVVPMFVGMLILL